MVRAISSLAFKGVSSLPGLMALIVLVLANPGVEAEPALTLAWREQEDTGELEGDFEERVQELQGWLRQRDAERRQSWGNDVVTPENPAMKPSSRYFSDRGYDGQGYRRLNENTRFRLRTRDDSWGFDEDRHAGSLSRAGKPFEDSSASEADAAEDSGDVVKRTTKTGSRHGKRKKRVRRR